MAFIACKKVTDFFDTLRKNGLICSPFFYFKSFKASETSSSLMLCEALTSTVSPFFISFGSSAISCALLSKCNEAMPSAAHTKAFA